MANLEHRAKIKRGVDAWNRWRRESQEARPDLSGVDLLDAYLYRADLGSANLSGARLGGADLGMADLNQANLREADLGGANLSGANLRGATLYWADLSQANLGGANLSGADLSGAKLGAAILSNADLSEAFVWGTAFVNVDLREVKGLESIRHKGPSSIGLDTIYKSKGRIPPEFLRGCGVPENFIAYMSSLVGTAIEFYSLFISYSTQDEEFAKRLHADLQANGVRCWFAPHSMRRGEKIHRQIDEAVRVHDRLLLVLSPASMASGWVSTEIAFARRKEKDQGKDVLFPISLCPYSEIRKWECFDPDIGTDSAREIRQYYIPDFTNWKDHDAYKSAFGRLLADLKGKS